MAAVKSVKVSPHKRWIMFLLSHGHSGVCHTSCMCIACFAYFSRLALFCLALFRRNSKIGKFHKCCLSRGMAVLSVSGIEVCAKCQSRGRVRLTALAAASNREENCV